MTNDISNCATRLTATTRESSKVGHAPVLTRQFFAMEAGGEQVVHTRRADVEAYVTKDGSVIRELMHPNVHGNSNASVAEAVVAAGQTTSLHMYMLTGSAPLLFVGGAFSG